MNILILGSGGREHALAWACLQNPKADRVIVAPGNAGIADLTEVVALDAEDGAAVLAYARGQAIDLVIIGPEAPLAAGVADVLRAAGLAVFGPDCAAAEVEASKSFTKALCDSVGAPTAAWARFEQATPALAWLATNSAPIVIKADGLAAGKGVVVAETMAEAEQAVRAVFDGAFGAAGASVVIEEFMPGEEASFFVLVDGEEVLAMGSAQDHKRLEEGDQGPNTGGMGAYSPAPVFTAEIEAQVMAEIIRPVAKELAARGTPYRGVLYAGLMIHEGRARLVEFNARFGDPEAQVLMLRLGAQALDLMQATAEGRLAGMQAAFADDHALVVVAAARGYPGTAAKGGLISGAENAKAATDRLWFHAATARDETGQLIANGGRVLGATARGASLAEAHQRAYAMLDGLAWEDGIWRRDIGWRALSGERS